VVVLEIERERRRNGTILSIASSTERNPLTSRSPSAQPTAATTLSGLRSGLQPISGVPVGGGYHAQQWWMGLVPPSSGWAVEVLTTSQADDATDPVPITR
jgi:hypothetical protein